MSTQQHGHGQDADGQEPAAFWEALYGEREGVWSGRANQALVDEAGTLPAGRALDLGSGEGGDAVWLADRGWEVTGLEISPTALSRAADATRRLGLDGRTRFVLADLAQAPWPDGVEDQPYDLVSACFLQSPVTFPRAEVLVRAAGLTRVGGHVLVVAHAAPPPWSQHVDDGTDPHLFPAPADYLATVTAVGAWDVVVAQVRTRSATGPDGEQGLLEDSVVLARRTG
jgi:SAM-dependent methyltransferase